MEFCKLKNPPEYTDKIEHWTRDTYADGEEMGNVIEQLLNNDHYLKETENQKLNYPEFDDSGAVDEIKDFPSFLATWVSGTKITTLLRNLKAGLKFVLHTGQLVNNCVTDRPDLPLAAAQGKVLMDLCAKLNSDLNNGNLSFEYTDALYYILQVGADTVRKKCSGTLKRVRIIEYSTGNQGSSVSATYNVKAHYPNLYASLTNANFVFGVIDLYANNAALHMVGSYNPSTGIYTASMDYTSGWGRGWNSTLIVDMFYIE